MRILGRLQDLLYPRKCVLCDKLLLKEETDLCAHCRINAPAFEGRCRSIPYVDGWTAVWFYEGQVRESLLRYKFRGRSCYAQAYGRILAAGIAERFQGEFDVLTYVPVSRRRNLRRGYDQVKLLAQAVARELGCRNRKTLRKVRHNQAQSTIPEADRRRANVLGVYRVRHPERIQGKRVLLLDDIMTTGATVSECAKVLKLAGAERVLCASLALARSGNR